MDIGRENLQHNADAKKLPGNDQPPPMREDGVSVDEVSGLRIEIARLKEANAGLTTQLARWKMDGEPEGWREFIEITAKSGCGVANGVTIASLARKLLVSTENSRKVVEGVVTGGVVTEGVVIQGSAVQTD